MCESRRLSLSLFYYRLILDRPVLCAPTRTHMYVLYCIAYSRRSRFNRTISLIFTHACQESRCAGVICGSRSRSYKLEGGPTSEKRGKRQPQTFIDTPVRSDSLSVLAPSPLSIASSVTTRHRLRGSGELGEDRELARSLAQLRSQAFSSLLRNRSSPRVRVSPRRAFSWDLAGGLSAAP